MNKKAFIKETNLKSTPVDHPYLKSLRTDKIEKKQDMTNTLLFLLLWTMGFKLIFAVWEFPLITTFAKAGYSFLYMGGLMLYIYKIKKEKKK